MARFDGEVLAVYRAYILPALSIALVVFIVALWRAGLHHVMLRYVGVQVMGRLTPAVTGSLMVLLVIDLALTGPLDGRPVPIGVGLIAGAFAFVGLAALRSVGRLWVVMTSTGNRGDHRVLILGAGDSGSLQL